MCLRRGSARQPQPAGQTQRMDSWLCAKDVAKLLGVTPATAARLMRRGEIQAFRLGQRVWRTRRSWLQAYIDSAAKSA